MKNVRLLFLSFALLLIAACGQTAGKKVDGPTVILGREIGKSGGNSVVADTTSRFHVNDLFNIEVIVPDGFRVTELRLKVFRIEDAAGRQLGSEFLSRSQSLKKIDPKASQLVINNSAKQRTVAKFIGARTGRYRLEVHTDQYKLAEKEFEVYKKSGK